MDADTYSRKRANVERNAGKMLNFDFITDEQFRNSLQSDYSELQTCLQNDAWKAVHVLAGSIIEALLIEYLLIAPNPSSRKNPLSLTLDEAIKACQQINALNERSAKLSDVVKDYRNLIHPGRVIRLKEQFGKDTADIAVALVSIIASELAAKRKENYGPTAEQIVRKLALDDRSAPLITGLLSETSETERRRLVNGVVWTAYRAQVADPLHNVQTLWLLRDCYRQALHSLPNKDQVLAAQRFAKMVRQESAEELALYADCSFSCKDMSFLEKNDKEIVKTHMFSRWEATLPTSIGESSQFLPESLSGLGAHIEENDLYRFVRLCLRFVLSASDKSQSDFSYLAMIECASLPDDKLREKFIESLKQRREKLSNFAENAKRLDDLISSCIEGIPF